MTKYLLLYQGGGEMPSSEEEYQSVIKKWTDWYNSLGSALVDPGNPFTQEIRSISSDGNVTIGTKGIAATGYTIIEVGTLKEAVKMGEGCPLLLAGGQIEVYETFQIG